MALSGPVLITDKVNIWREIEADGAGLVVNDDVNAIAAGLREMCSLSAPQRDAIGRKARKCFLDHYDLEENALQLLTLRKRLSARPEIPLEKRRVVSSSAHARPDGVIAQWARGLPQFGLASFRQNLDSRP